jgi:hypothetical protein
MKPGEDPQLRSDVVMRARARVAKGFYDEPETVDGALEVCLQPLWDAVCHCPVGNGSGYRDAVSELLPALFPGTFDAANRGVEIGNCGARIDLELPLRLEALRELPLWGHWANEYGIRSVLIEVKNESGRAAVEDAKQLIGDLVVAGRGRFGFLVARRGFSTAAMRYMSQVAKIGTFLVVPLSEVHLADLCRLQARGPEAVCGALRATATQLLQVA